MKKLFSVLVLCFLVASELVAQNEKFKEDDNIEVVTANDNTKAPRLRRHHILVDGALGVFPLGSGASFSIGGILGYQYKFTPWLSAQAGYVVRVIGTALQGGTSLDGVLEGHGFYLGGTFTTTGEHILEAFLQSEFLFGPLLSTTIAMPCGSASVSAFNVSPRLGIGYRSLPIGSVLVFRVGVAANLWVVGDIAIVMPDVYIGFGFAF